jgi:inorganic pyrophosphatase
MKKAPALDRIDAVEQETGCVNVIIETPTGSHNKYKYDGKLAASTLGGVLSAGAVFPFDFGFVPSTLGEDGDPLDVLVLLDESVPTGCLVRARLIGAIEVEQTEPRGKRVRNDRLLAVVLHAHTRQHIRKSGDLPPKLIDEVEAFFVDYDAQRGKRSSRYGAAVRVKR